MKKLYLLIFALLVFISYNHAQLSATIGKVTRPLVKGDTVSVPLSVKNFNNIGALGFYIWIDTLELKYDSVHVVDSYWKNIRVLLGDTLWNLDTNKPEGPQVKLKFAWDATGGHSWGNATLCRICFTYLAPTWGEICFDDPNCEVSDVNQTSLSVNYTCGLIGTVDGYNNNSVEYSINVFPNPSNGNVNITYNEKSNLNQITVFSLSGEKVYDALVNNKQNTYNLDLSALSKGMYLMRLVSKDNVSYNKIVIQ